jgi:foldase protein PrsA
MRTKLRTTVAGLAAGALAVVGLAACGDAADPVAATVAGEKILVSEVDEAVDRFENTAQFEQLAQQGSTASARRQFEQAYLSQHIRRAVLAPKAEELGIEVTASDIDDELETIKSQFPSEEEFEKAVEERGFTMPELRDLVRDQLLEDRLRAEVTQEEGPSDQELRDYYDSHQEDYRQTQVQHILVEDMELGRRISERLQSAPAAKVGALFAQLAKKESTDASNANDAGRLGWVGAGDLVPEFEIAMDELDINEVSTPVRTQFGVHVIRVTGRRLQSFADVTEEINAQLSSQAQESAYQDFLQQAYEDAEVELNPRYGELDPTTGQVVNASADDVPGADESNATPSG